MSHGQRSIGGEYRHGPRQSVGASQSFRDAAGSVARKRTAGRAPSGGSMLLLFWNNPDQGNGAVEMPFQMAQLSHNAARTNSAAK